MNVAESNPKTEEVKMYSRANQLSSLNNVNAQAVSTVNSLVIKKILIITSISVAVVAASATVVGVYVFKSSEETSENQAQTTKNYTKEEFYSGRTKSYFNLINKLENEKTILYHWNLELNQNNEAFFKNKYKDLYDYSTDLNPKDTSIGYKLYKPDNYRMIDSDLKKYYQAINKTMPNHLVYGPSINGEEYSKNQSLYSDNIKLGKENKNGITISFNIKKGGNHENMNSGQFFGFSTKNEKGLNVGIYYGAIRFRAGGYGNTYDYQDGVKIGYKENMTHILNIYITDHFMMIDGIMYVLSKKY